MLNTLLQLQTRRGCLCQDPTPMPTPMPLVESQASSSLPRKVPRLPVNLPHRRPSPLLLFIGHDQAGVQDVFFWLPCAVPGREKRGQSCPAPHVIHRGHSCSTKAQCLQALAPSWSRKLSPIPKSCLWPAKLGQGPSEGSNDSRTPLTLSTDHTAL